MREVFQQELADVQGRLVEIARLVRAAITDATKAVATSNVSLAERVIDGDRLIDERSLALDELAIEILARQAPVARDLRIVVSALRISASLERMGDLAAHIAQVSRYRYPGQVGPEAIRTTFEQMGAVDVEIASKLVELLATQRIDIADEIKSDDIKVDALHRSTFDILQNEDDGVAVIDATLMSRYHERFADHAVSIAKKIEYLATGDWHQLDWQQRDAPGTAE
ncbi:phosphate transport system regulatory protein PhoU [Pseudoclavibacter endophyticus]|uniref:Phosphate-specific transport system accessory protein PhoU n=1 Tax=Pseudoclavibacter endophyticus TaxID=1778590 RepID=A0A6H9WRK8_9MICO|nr:phosphate signaling complex protein PhoU [Pseudoclavibacter endophyticus]KAB1649405.1 phosphate signaling complex protein PhoU [Pseudoclavibacter endophyticus]GGA62917.1 phosphate transport system regulatory protein PhoU [Pseudoclavibacter endophyticus]